jgi:flagellar basal-body rod protein FlgB
MFEKLTDHLNLREKALDAAWLRNEVIAQNIANVDTPGYKKKSVSFEEYLDQAVDSGSFKGNTTDGRHMQIGAGNAENVPIKVTSDYSNLSTRLDGNNVDVEKEMADSAKNDIRYNTLIQSVSDSYKRLMSAISEGRR